MTQISKNLKIVEGEGTSSIVYTHPFADTPDRDIIFDSNGVTVEGVLFSDGVITGVDISQDLGANATPVSRTNNPIVGANAPNTNIDVLDATIGADATPVTRTNSPIAVANTVNANLDALDAAIGADADLTVVTRTTGQLVVNSNIMTKFDVVDAAIGFDAQMSGTGKNVSKNLTIYQNLDALDTYKSVQTIKKTIGGVGVEGCDFNFATAADQAEQVIDLGAIVPSLSQILGVFMRTNNVFTGAISLVAEVGTSSSGAELIDSSTIYAADAIAPTDAGIIPTVPIVAAIHIYVSATPGANWSLVTAGKVSVYVTFINVANI